jgi:hypothetical protein
MTLLFQFYICHSNVKAKRGPWPSSVGVETTTLAIYIKRLKGSHPDYNSNPQGDLLYRRPKFWLGARLQGLKAALNKGCDDKSLRDKWYDTFSFDRCQTAGFYLIDIPGR